MYRQSNTIAAPSHSSVGHAHQEHISYQKHLLMKIALALPVTVLHTSMCNCLPTILLVFSSSLTIAASKFARGELVVLEVLSQLQLVDLACSCVWDLFDKHHIVWYPPLGNFALQLQND